MYIDIVPNRNSPPAVLLRESYREGKKFRSTEEEEKDAEAAEHDAATPGKAPLALPACHQPGVPSP